MEKAINLCLHSLYQATWKEGGGGVEKRRIRMMLLSEIEDKQSNSN